MIDLKGGKYKMQDRLIKKLWHTNKKKFINEFSILQTINSEGKFEHTYFERNPKTLQHERLSSCQIKELLCTGLKDSNGRLIFEGDILKETYDSEGKTYTDITVVKYNEKSAGFIMARPAHEKDITYFDDINLEKENFVVIGNIYENPELLEVSDGDNSSE